MVFATHTSAILHIQNLCYICIKFVKMILAFCLLFHYFASRARSVLTNLFFLPRPIFSESFCRGKFLTITFLDEKRTQQKCQVLLNLLFFYLLLTILHIYGIYNSPISLVTLHVTPEQYDRYLKVFHLRYSYYLLHLSSTEFPHLT